MPILKTIAIFLIGFLFYLALSSMLGILVVSKMTEYGSMKSVFSDILESQLNKTPQLDVMNAALTGECALKDSITMPFQGQNVTIDCKEYLKSKSVAKTLAGSMFDSIYNKKYDCDFIDCVKQGNVAVLMSSATSKFIETIFSYAVLTTIVLGVLFSFLLREIAKIMKNIGGCLLATALPFLLIFNIKSLLPAEMSFAAPIVEKIFGTVTTYMYGMIVLGAILIAAGFVLGRKK